jgi:hypothetical protein
MQCLSEELADDHGGDLEAGLKRERLKILHQMKSSMQMTKSTVGDIVYFHSSGRQIKRGIIHRLNKKTASIITGDKQQWNVAPGLLKHEEKD